MGKETKIAWAHSTFNATWGCVEVSPECDHCYARELARRFGFNIWGKDAPRRFFGEKHWSEPIKWEAEAAKTGQPWRVFWDSMSDLCEDRRDLDEVRDRAWDMQVRTPHLTHMLLTKRPDNYRRLFLKGRVPLENQWFGTTVGIESSAWRMRELLKLESRVLWVSAEPLLGPVDFSDFLCRTWRSKSLWVVIGGESGPGSRPMELSWARQILVACQDKGIPCFFKQRGGWPDKRDRMKDFPADLRIRQFPV